MKMNRSGVRFGGHFVVECIKPDGRMHWREEMDNLVVNVGLQHILNTVFSGSAQTTTWYVGLCSSSPTIASTNTMASHAGWTEKTSYDEATRQAYTEVRTNQSLSNTAAKAAFTISATSVIGGAFLTSLNTKGGTTGTLMCAAAFTGGNKSADDNDTIQVTYTFTAGDDA